MRNGKRKSKMAINYRKYGFQFADEWDEKRFAIETDFWFCVCSRPAVDIVEVIADNLLKPDEFVIRFMTEWFMVEFFFHSDRLQALKNAMLAFPGFEFDVWRGCDGGVGVVLVAVHRPQNVGKLLVSDLLERGAAS